ncbi:MAG: hypothetical protein C5S44_01040 [Candidatus Methanocomedens sp.]|nr:MAG: hypothetical protein C5S44_01040 [ANME-2 cluster archaeon]
MFHQSVLKIDFLIILGNCLVDQPYPDTLVVFTSGLGISHSDSSVPEVTTEWRDQGKVPKARSLIHSVIGSRTDHLMNLPSSFDVGS